MNRNQEIISDLCRIITDTSKNQRVSFADENCILTLCCLFPNDQPRVIAEKYTNLSGKPLDRNGVIRKLKMCKLGHIAERMRILSDVTRISNILSKAIGGQLEDIALLDAKKFNLDIHPQKRRLVLLMLIETTNSLKNSPAYRDALHMNKDFASECLDAMIAELAANYQQIQEKTPNKTQRTATTYEHEILKLTTSLNRANSLLSKLQQSFEEQLAESRVEEQAKVISMLNSDKYGYILDMLISAQSGFKKLRTKKIDVPLEIKSVHTLVRRMLEFVDDCEITPMLPIGDTLTVTPKEIEGYTYFGTPFEGDSETKCVEVVSPGWEILSRDIIISHPKVKEIESTQC